MLGPAGAKLNLVRNSFLLSCWCSRHTQYFGCFNGFPVFCRVASPLGSSMLHSLSRYSRYISILDVDQKTLRCPPYRGRLLANIADHRTFIRRGSTYLLHIQSTLCRLAAKAFLLAFTHHLHVPVSSEEGPEDIEARRRGFLQEQLGLDEEDSQILLHLGRLITQQYLQPPSTVAAPAFSFNYTTSVLYKI